MILPNGVFTPPNQSRVIIQSTGEVTYTDLWKRTEFNVQLIQPQSNASSIYSLGLNDYGVLRGEEALIDGGLGTGAVYIHGCPLRCKTCYQPEFFSKAARFYTSHEGLIEILFELEKQGVNTLSIVMATYQPRVIDALRDARTLGLKTPLVWNYSGAVSVLHLSLVSDLFKIFLPDLKGLSKEVLSFQGLPESYRAIALAGIKYLIRSEFQTIIRVLMVPSMGDPVGEIEKIISALELRGSKTARLSLLTQFYDVERSELFKISDEVLDQISDLGREQNVEIDIQNKEASRAYLS